MQGNNGQIASELKSAMVLPEQSTGNPALDFIKSNMKPVTKAVDPAQAIASGEPVVEVKEVPKVEEPSVEPSTEKHFEMPEVKPEVKTEPEAKPEGSVEASTEKEEEDGKESWKGLRNKVTRAINKQKELEEALEKERQEKERILKGEVEIEPVKKIKEELEQTRKYRDLYDLESSPEFIQTYVEPLNNTKAMLQRYSQEYGVPLTELEKLIDVESVAQVNKFLGSRFDPVGASEVKNLLNQARMLKGNMQQAKDAPKQTLQTLMSSAEEARRQQQMERVAKIDTSAKTSWVRAAQRLQTAEKFPELQFRGNPEHDTVVKQIYDNAAKEFGIFVQYMADAGVKELPEPIAEILAERFVRSELANSIAESRSIIFNEYQEVLTNSALKKKYDRPPLGGTFRGGVPVTDMKNKGPNSPTEAADAILSKIPGIGR